MAEDIDALSDPDFRTRLRSWLAATFPEDWRDPSLRLRGEDARWWVRTQYEAGWRAPAWPKRFGGMGLSLAKQIIYQEEMERHGVARTLDQGARMVAPILIRYGSQAQQERYLQPILTGEHMWCQGYSEPNAGSDLANLQTSARRDGNRFFLNGQKIWTTQAADASHIYVLARTAKLAKKQEGITLFLLETKTKGLKLRPIRNLADEEEFYEVFFDEVEVGIDEVVGEVDRGWGIAKALLGFERFSQGSPSLARFALQMTLEVARTLNLTEDGRYADRLARLACDVHDASALFRDLCAAVESGDDPVDDYSMAKLVSAELFQRVSECLFDLVGDADSGGGAVLSADFRARAQRIFMIARPVTIFGGTSEIQRNLLAKRILPAGV